MRQPGILFCEDPFEKNKVDPDFGDEFTAALSAGFTTLLVNYEDLISSGREDYATSKIKPAAESTLLIYRGWMLTPSQYELLYTNLLAKNYRLINTPAEYQNCHYLPDSLKFIENYTPKTVYESFENEQSIDNLIEKLKIFGNKPAIVKDFVKSEKHDWDTACYIQDASDTTHARDIITTFIRLRGLYLNKGLVVREFIELKPLTTHSKSGMPLTEEYRIFFVYNSIAEVYDYWEEGVYATEKLSMQLFRDIGGAIQSNFFSMDIARKKDGSFTIIELGDGQVAGLPDSCNKEEFYNNLKKGTCQYNK